MGAPPGTAGTFPATDPTLIRIVLDTNILVSVALPDSRLRPLAEAWEAGRCRLLISREIFDEYLRVLTYPKFRLSSDDVTRVLERGVLPYAEWVTVTSRIDVIREDPSDNAFLACALDGKADAIVSGDHHLLELGTFHAIPILTGRQFLSQLT